MAQKLNVPLAICPMFPMHPTGEFASGWLSSPYHGSYYANYATHLISYFSSWTIVGKFYNQFRCAFPPLYCRMPWWSVSCRRKLGLPEQWSLQFRHLPCFGLWSPALFPKPAEWPEHVYVTGHITPVSVANPNVSCSCELVSSLLLARSHIHFHLTDQYTPDPLLATFLSEGPAPVFVGFGSAPVQDWDRLLSMSVSALKSLKLRGIIQNCTMMFVFVFLSFLLRYSCCTTNKDVTRCSKGERKRAFDSRCYLSGPSASLVAVPQVQHGREPRRRGHGLGLSSSR